MFYICFHHLRLPLCTTFMHKSVVDIPPWPDIECTVQIWIFLSRKIETTFVASDSIIWPSKEIRWICNIKESMQQTHRQRQINKWEEIEWSLLCCHSTSTCFRISYNGRTLSTCVKCFCIVLSISCGSLSGDVLLLNKQMMRIRSVCNDNTKENI